MALRFILWVVSVSFLIGIQSPAMASKTPVRYAGVIKGRVLSSGVPLAFSRITLYGSRSHKGRKILGKAHTNASGSFRIFYRKPENSNQVLYLMSKGGRLGTGKVKVPRPFVLAVAIAPPHETDWITLNERTTVATAFAMAQYIKGRNIYGRQPGLQLASKMIKNLVDLETGEPGATIANDDNEPDSTYSALKTLNEMANLVAGCATDAKVCKGMMRLALPLKGPAPRNTFNALANMARTPWRDPVPLFNLVASDYYDPDLGSKPPSAWILSLKFKGNPTQLAGPGNMAFDREGQMWIVNNLVTDSSYILPDCSSQLLFRMDPVTGQVDTFTGGGILGAGYGVGIAPDNDIWVGNYGFKGSTCPKNIANDSVSQFAPDGMALSPDAQNFDRFNNPKDGGWTEGGIGWAQGTVANRKGDIWIASCNGEQTEDGQVDVTIYRNGNPNDWFAIIEDDLVKPFDIAFDKYGVAWVTGTNSDNVFAFYPDGSQIEGSPFFLGTDAKPMGIASDKRGNVWVSLSGEIDLPCPPPLDKPPPGVPGIAMIDRKGVQINTRPDPPLVGYTPPAGLTIAWGMAVDGDDNVWVANFTKGGVSSFCGANKGACPKGYKTGEALSPVGTGYHSDLLDRNTAVEIDSSGNVWLANNWKDLAIKPDPVGDSMVVFIGLAAPVKTPLIGTPRKP